jgi:hypothetical protein
MVKPCQATTYGDLQILDPESDISFDDGSTSKFTMTSEAGSKASRRQDGENNVFFKADSTNTFPQADIPHSKPTQIRADKIRISSSSSSDTSAKRFSVRNIISRQRATSFDAAVKQRRSFLKRKAVPWFKTRQGSRDKRIKYHSFSNDGYDDEDDLLISTISSRDQQVFLHDNKIVNHDIETPENLISPLVRKGAYDNRPIHNILFHGNERDDSFHRDRKIAEPLLNLETMQQMAALNAEEWNSSNNFDNGGIQWSPPDGEMRGVFTSTHENVSPVPPALHFNPFEQEAGDPPLKRWPYENVQAIEEAAKQDISTNKKSMMQMSSLANCGCLPRKRRLRGRSEQRNSSYTFKRTNATKGHFSLSKASYATEKREIMNKMSRSNARQSLLDEETFEKESRQLDILANEFKRESPQLIRMSVASQLSAITEVDEDLTQRSSNLSAHSSIEHSGHLRYVSLNPMLDDASLVTEEPNLFASTDATEKSNIVSPVHVEHTGVETLADEKHKYFVPSRSQYDPADRYLSKDKRNGENMFHFKGEEIALSSNSDEDSSGGVSDITEEFIHFPTTSLVFKKALDVSRDVVGKEEIKSEQIQESRDDLEELKPLAHLQI